MSVTDIGQFVLIAILLILHVLHLVNWHKG